MTAQQGRKRGWVEKSSTLGGDVRVYRCALAIWSGSRAGRKGDEWALQRPQECFSPFLDHSGECKGSREPQESLAFDSSQWRA